MSLVEQSTATGEFVPLRGKSYVLQVVVSTLSEDEKKYRSMLLKWRKENKGKPRERNITDMKVYLKKYYEEHKEVLKKRIAKCNKERRERRKAEGLIVSKKRGRPPKVKTNQVSPEISYEAPEVVQKVIPKLQNPPSQNPVQNSLTKKLDKLISDLECTIEETKELAKQVLNKSLQLSDEPIEVLDPSYDPISRTTISQEPIGSSDEEIIEDD